MLRISNGRGPRPASGGFETFSWFYFRASGAILLIMVLVHLYIMHVCNDVSCTTYAFVAMRYSNIFWRVFRLVATNARFDSRRKWTACCHR